MTKGNRTLTMLFFFLVTHALSLHAENTPTPIGTWNTMTDGTHHVNGVVQIWQENDNTLSGKIIKAIPDQNEKVLNVCNLCQGENYNKPIVGLVFMWGFKYDGQKWSDGKILDPRTGKVYRANLEPDETGQHLQVHGFIGIPLFGLTKVWERSASL